MCCARPEGSVPSDCTHTVTSSVLPPCSPLPSSQLLLSGLLSLLSALLFALLWFCPSSRKKSQRFCFLYICGTICHYNISRQQMSSFCNSCFENVLPDILVIFSSFRQKKKMWTSLKSSFPRAVRSGFFFFFVMLLATETTRVSTHELFLWLYEKQIHFIHIK